APSTIQRRRAWRGAVTLLEGVAAWRCAAAAGSLACGPPEATSPVVRSRAATTGFSVVTAAVTMREICASIDVWPVTVAAIVRPFQQEFTFAHISACDRKYRRENHVLHRNRKPRGLLARLFVSRSVRPASRSGGGPQPGRRPEPKRERTLINTNRRSSRF